VTEIEVGTLEYSIVGENVTVYKEENGDPVPCFAKVTDGHIEWQAMMAAGSTNQQILDACDDYLRTEKGWC